MPNEINIQGEDFFYIKERRMGGAVYVNATKNKYARTGDASEIHGEVNLTRELKTRGFPVPEVIDEGSLGRGLYYYIESALGDVVFGELFQKETKENNVVSDATFDRFTTVALEYAQAQFDEQNFLPHSRADVARTVLFYNVLRNNPPSEENKKKFNEAFERATDRVLKLPFGYLQSDLNAYNILEGGVIDFENANSGPVGFDILTNATAGRFWPEIALAYRVTDEQIGRYNKKIDECSVSMGLPKMSDFRNDFLVLKAIRATHKGKGSEDHQKCNPQFWAWRVRVRDWCIEEYLQGNTIRTREFEKVGGPVTKHPEHIG